ncbi:hypothetical protein HN604_01070 [archaeon]|jgi:hypothetical protein|nr:hypothetical protein [archaeon]MBT6182701.1 hypothetical protein [archaeon]MBT6606702.1 hypothetical protein [archaeon]MBT7251945.1 hypothetical protein [archaeon]MBT7660654.1 hypothetical protein [archaeon]
MSRLINLIGRREGQLEIARRIRTNTAELSSMSDEEVRLLNHHHQKDWRLVGTNPPASTFSVAYEFACEYYKIEGCNLLSEVFGHDGFPKPKDYCDLQSLVIDRKMTQTQYNSFENIFEKIESGDFENYQSVRLARGKLPL